MNRIKLDEDIKPLSEFRSKVSQYIEQIHNTKRPLLITQNGKSSAVLLDVSEYENLMDKLDLLQDIQISTKQIEEGKGIPHEEAKNQILNNNTENKNNEN